MFADRASSEIKKAMAYDIIDILESSVGKKHDSPEEIKALIKAHISSSTK